MSDFGNLFRKNMVGNLAALSLNKLASGQANPIPTGVPGLYVDSNGVLQVVDASGNVSPLAGEELVTVTAAASISAGQWVYVSAANTANLAQANAAATANVLGVAPAAITNATTGPVQTAGIFTTTGLTAGSYYYLSASSAGAITATAPSAAGQYVVPVGLALSTTQLLMLTAPPAAAVGPVTLSAPHFVGTGSAPTPAAGTGAGTGPTITATGSDTSFLLSVATGTTPAASNATVVTLTFAAAYAAAPKVSFSPANAAAAALSGTTAPFFDSASTTTAVCVFKGGSAALTGSTTYLWIVDVVG